MYHDGRVVCKNLKWTADADRKKKDREGETKKAESVFVGLFRSGEDIMSAHGGNAQAKPSSFVVPQYILQPLQVTPETRWQMLSARNREALFANLQVPTETSSGSPSASQTTAAEAARRGDIFAAWADSVPAAEETEASPGAPESASSTANERQQRKAYAARQLEALMPRMGHSTQSELALARRALGDRYVLDLLDRIVMRLFAVNRRLRNSYLFQPSHASKYDYEFLWQLYRKHKRRSAAKCASGLATIVQEQPGGNSGDDSASWLSLLSLQAAASAPLAPLAPPTPLAAPALEQARSKPTARQLCRWLGRARVVEHTPHVKMHLYQQEADDYLQRTFRPYYKLRKLPDNRFTAYVNGDLRFDERTREVQLQPEGTSFLDDFVRIAVELEAVQKQELYSLLEAHALQAHPHNVLHLIEALVVKLTDNPWLLTDLACVSTGDAEDFLLSSVQSLAQSQASLPSEGGSLLTGFGGRSPGSKQYLCDLLAAQSTERSIETAEQEKAIDSESKAAQFDLLMHTPSGTEVGKTPMQQVEETGEQ